MKRILRYLKGILDFGIYLTKSLNITLFGYYDTDWTSDLDDKRSTIGFFVYLYPNLVS